MDQFKLFSRLRIICVGGEVKDSNMQRNDLQNITHSFILGIGFIGYEIGL